MLWISKIVATVTHAFVEDIAPIRTNSDFMILVSDLLNVLI